MVETMRGEREAVAGIREEAYWFPAAYDLLVRSKGGTLHVALSRAELTGSDEEFKAMAVSLAKKAVLRL